MIILIILLIGLAFIIYQSFGTHKNWKLWQ